MNREDNLLTKVDSEFVKMPQWVIDTNGSNLLDVLNHPQVDFSRTFSNNINEIYEILGIEAAREAIINEITDLLSFDGTYINFRHISLLADVMTNRGSLMSIDRHGINKSDRGPLAKCSFEETPDIISKAAIFGEYDKIKGVSSNIMLGQPVMSGTGFSEVLFDEKVYTEKYEQIQTQKESDEAPEEILESLQEATDEYCAQDNFGFNFDMQHLGAENMSEQLPSVNISIKTEKK
jgi:DNA-directed RNA polymerase II subunit RPB1